MGSLLISLKNKSCYESRCVSIFNQHHIFVAFIRVEFKDMFVFALRVTANTN